MNTKDIALSLSTLFAELADGPPEGAFVLNSGDVGLLRSLDKVSAAAASRSSNEGATIAAHTQHVRYGLSLMNRWAAEGGNPFADANWNDAWTISTVSEVEWDEIRDGLDDEARRWREALTESREVNEVELNGLVGSIAHLAYHLGAIRQIDRSARGPKEGAVSAESAEATNVPTEK